MTRINARLLVQRVDNLIVIVDENVNREVAWHVDDSPAIIQAIAYLSLGLDPTVDAPAAHP